MVVVTTDEGRGNSRDLYVPTGERSMAHHSYRSPDGRWVLVVEMDSRGEILPCRVVPFQGTNDIKIVGAPNGTCLSGAWSPDGKWIYLTAKTDDFLIWRQRFSDGDPAQLTFGPTSQDLYFSKANGQTRGEELWIKELNRGKVEKVLPESPILGYSVSRDGKEVAFAIKDLSGHTNLWVAPTGRRSSPVRISSAAVEDSPFFVPNGDLIIRAIEGGSKA